MPTERIMLVAMQLFVDGCITTGEAATLAGITYEGARQMLIKMSRVATIYREGENWVLLRD